MHIINETQPTLVATLLKQCTQNSTYKTILTRQHLPNNTY